jgi:2,4-dienoyl-CoA reductase-like NADH-dependent reductase (Old Yellow Enzyme family)/thioredoxin reductase
MKKNNTHLGPDLSALFSTIMLGSKTIKNKIIMAPMGTLFATWDGRVTERQINYYHKMASGGVGIVVVEYAYVHPIGQVYNGQLAVDRDQTIDGLRKLARAIKDGGAAAALQIVHGGRVCFPEVTGSLPLAPSRIPSIGQALPRAATIEEIKGLVTFFAEAAARAKEAEFDIVELHMAHGYLIHSFLSPLTNQRTDSYGGSLINRARFPIEVLENVKKIVGDTVQITCKITGSDYIDGGLTGEDAQFFAKRLEEAGAAGLTVSGGMKNETAQMVTPPMSMPRGFRVELAQKIKNAVSIPVATVGRVNDPILAAKIIHDGKADMVAVGRAFLADSEWPQKAANGLLDQICPCIACNQGCIGRIMDGLPITCLANPALGREKQFKIEKAAVEKIIVIIGGGPGGMAAARSLSLRGHKAVIIEKGNRLGGRLNTAAIAPFKDEIGYYVKYMRSEMARLNVEVRLNQTVTKSLIKKIRPDFILLASGATPVVPKNTGDNSENQFLAEEVIVNSSLVGERIVIVGGGSVGLETAEVLLDMGKAVILVEMADQIGLDLEVRARTLATTRLWTKNIDVIAKAIFQTYLSSERRVILDRKGITEYLEDIDTVVFAVGYESKVIELKQLLEPLGVPMKVIGDALYPRSAMEAIREGFEFGFCI